MKHKHEKDSEEIAGELVNCSLHTHVCEQCGKSYECFCDDPQPEYGICDNCVEGG